MTVLKEGILAVVRSKNVPGIQKNVTQGKRQGLRKPTGMKVAGFWEPLRGDHTRSTPGNSPGN